MTLDFYCALILSLLVVWDLGRRFAERGRQVSPEDIDQLQDRVTLAESEYSKIAKLEAAMALHANQHNKLVHTVEEHSKKLTEQALKRLGR